MFKVPNEYKANELVPMTRRYPNLRKKVLERDAKITTKLIKAWDTEKDSNKVLEIFIKQKDNFSPERYWEIMRSVWIICGSIDTADMFRSLMQSNKRSKFYFSTPEETRKLKAMDGLIKVYRATSDKHDNGLSWTTSKEYAVRYGKDFSKTLILEKTISKNKIFAFIDRNNESEIIIL